MLILTIRTDKPDAEIGLYDNEAQISYEIWQAHRALAETLHQKIFDLLEKNSKTWHDIRGIVVYSGSGSFTGLRIGLTVANTIAAAEQIPIIGLSDTDDWISLGITKLTEGLNDRMVLPQYGAPVHITPQKK